MDTGKFMDPVRIRIKKPTDLRIWQYDKETRQAFTVTIKKKGAFLNRRENHYVACNPGYFVVRNGFRIISTTGPENTMAGTGSIWHTDHL
jgi:hypothetical protein